MICLQKCAELIFIQDTGYSIHNATYVNKAVINRIVYPTKYTANLPHSNTHDVGFILFSTNANPFAQI